jgi:hypothetical protein
MAIAMQRPLSPAVITTPSFVFSGRIHSTLRSWNCGTAHELILRLSAHRHQQPSAEQDDNRPHQMQPIQVADAQHFLIWQSAESGR